MMVSYITGAKSQGFYHFDRKLPTIFQIQEFIEHAWDLGINAQGRLETGGIRGTRKYIGTPEVSINLQAQSLILKQLLGRSDVLKFRYSVRIAGLLTGSNC
jgi:hypothetical protein